MAKDRKLKVPKRIAGVKVPKKVRKTANKALKVANNPAALELAAAALAAAGASLTGRKTEDHRPRKPGEGGTDDRAARLADVVIAAALDGARRLLEGLEAAAAQEPPADPPQEAPAERPKRSRGASAAPAAAAARADGPDR